MAAWLKTACGALSMTVFASVMAAAPDLLELGYVARPGLAEVINGKPTGTYLPVAVAAALKSGLRFELRALPQKRLIAQTLVGRPNYCALGIYQTKERMAYAKFSLPFFRDPPLILAAAKSKEAAFRRYASFAALSRDQDLRLGMIEGYFYGPVLDPVVRQMHGNVESFVGTFDQDFSKIAIGRVDYILTFPAEFYAFLDRSAQYRARLVRIDMPDIPEGVMRHFMCSRAVSDAVLDKLNAGIAALNLNLKH